LIQTFGPTTTTATLTGLTNGTAYTFTVNVTNSVGASVYSNPVTLTPATVPNAPVNLTGSAGNEQVTLDWTLPTNVGGSALTATTIHGTSAQGSPFVKAFNPTTTTATLTGLTNGTTYTFTVTATNGVGTSADSNLITLTPTAPSIPITPPPSNVTPPPYIPTPPPTPLVPESITVFGKPYHVWATGINTATNITRSIQTNFVEERFALLAGASTSTPDPSAYLLDVLTGNGVTPAPTITAQETGAWLALYAQLGILPPTTSATSTVTLSSALTTLQHAHATPAQIANYLYQCWAYDWTTAQQKAATLG
jgi:hypothetical protein